MENLNIYKSREASIVNPHLITQLEQLPSYGQS